ncbi:hypothetical protein [Actinomycetospora callitridis]|uniref:hypothetical protein n=1 Tax=Actinomycetospora callitridis TaxID=913944 RepID=UPI002366F0F6|nr:hypothetical protein [Actinomycetospora callitridis]MDD7921088.1 hypothetical protein [Actinomycetospora callitridis]
MTEPPEPPPTIATMRTIGFVWIAVGVLAILGGAVATVFAVAVFGVLAALLGAGLVGIQQVRARSAIRASRTLTNAPVPPADPPSANPGRPPGPPPVGGPHDSPYDEGPLEPEDDQQDDGRGVEAPVGSPGGDEEELSISEEEDGTGSRTAEDEDPGGRRD